jgi:hypothetical protein
MTIATVLTRLDKVARDHASCGVLARPWTADGERTLLRWTHPIARTRGLVRIQVDGHGRVPVTPTLRAPRL